jgi:Ni,Fe-hydrogenase III small subunit
MLEEFKVIAHNGKQYIPDLRKAVVPEPFRGRPVISSAKADEKAVAAVCPTGAITVSPLCIDLGKCAFCGECAFAFPEKIRFTNDHKIATNVRENLLVKEGQDVSVTVDQGRIREEVKSTFGKSVKLRQVSAGGDNSCEWELGACGNANFDMSRYGIEFVASPRHADGVVVTGPVSANMAEALKVTWDAIPEPKIFVLCGVDAISGGIFAESKAIDRSLLDEVHVDLYIPGNPSHPLTIINGLLELTRG